MTSKSSTTTERDAVLDAFAPIHPGEILLEDYLLPLGLSQNALARGLNVPAQTVNQIVRGKRAITLDTALRLATYFDVSPQLWLNLQMRYDLEKASHDNLADKIAREVRPLNRAA